MNKPLLLTLAISGILLSACQDLPVAQIANLAGVPLPAAGGGANAATAQQEVWVDGQGFQANPQDLSACNISAQVTTQQERKALGEHKSLLNQFKDTVQDSMEQDNQLKTCMQGKNYVKIKAEPGKMPPQRAQNNFNGNGYPPNQNSFNNGYPPNQNGFNNGYPPNQNGFNNGYPPNQNGFNGQASSNMNNGNSQYPANNQYPNNPYPNNGSSPYPSNQSR